MHLSEHWECRRANIERALLRQASRLTYGNRASDHNRKAGLGPAALRRSKTRRLGAKTEILVWRTQMRPKRTFGSKNEFCDDCLDHTLITRRASVGVRRQIRGTCIHLESANYDWFGAARIARNGFGSRYARGFRPRPQRPMVRDLLLRRVLHFHASARRTFSEPLQTTTVGQKTNGHQVAAGR